MVMYLGLLVVVLVVIVMMRIARSASGSSGSNSTFKVNTVPTMLTDDVSSAADPATRLKQLQNMLNSGLITNDEYEAKRTQILDKL